MRRVRFLFCLLGSLVFVTLPSHAQSGTAKCDPSLGLAQMQHTAPQGRLQENGSPQTSRILALGKSAIPMLIACLTDETRTKQPIEDYWPVTTVGDIAFFYLDDLFTDSTWEHYTISGVVNWKVLQADYPNAPAWEAWYRFLKKHGRRYVQNSWSSKWKEDQSSIVWDPKEQCFKISLRAK